MLSSVARHLNAPRDEPRWALSHVLLLLISLTLYGPTLVSLWQGPWQDERHSHGPILMLITVWLYFHALSRRDASLIARERAEPFLGSLSLLLGLFLHVVGRSQSFVALETMSLVPVSMGIVLFMGGRPLLRSLAFCHVFILFWVPLPDSLVDGLIQPLKLAVSWSVEQILWMAGFAVARSGVILSIPPYRLLVADACSGVTSLFMLEAVGLLYLNLVHHTSPLRNVTLALMIIPISFASNVIRILILALVTHYLGDLVAGGIFHKLSGVILFVPALVLIIGLDGLLRRWSKPVPTPQADRADALPALSMGRSPWPVLPRSMGLLVLLLALTSTAMGRWMTPDPALIDKAPDLASVVPGRFGVWAAVAETPQIALAAIDADDKSKSQPYDQIVMRTYRNNAGQQVMMALAYAGAQQQDVKIHRPEVCYPAQGYTVTSLAPMTLPDGPAMRMTSKGAGREELVVYWVRIDRTRTNSGLRARWLILTEGMKGRLIDGSLFRVSVLMQAGQSQAQAEAVLKTFIQDFHQAVAGTQAGRVALPRFW